MPPVAWPFLAAFGLYALWLVASTHLDWVRGGEECPPLDSIPWVDRDGNWRCQR